MGARKLSMKELEKIQERAGASPRSLGAEEAHEHKDTFRLLEHIRALTAELEAEDRTHGTTIDARDRYEDAIGEAAASLGCTEEWSSLHDHAKCLVENAEAVTKERDRLKALLNSKSLVDLLTRLRDVHLSDLAPSVRDLRKAWLEAGRPGLLEPWERAS